MASQSVAAGAAVNMRPAATAFLVGTGAPVQRAWGPSSGAAGARLSPCASPLPATTAGGTSAAGPPAAVQGILAATCVTLALQAGRRAAGSRRRAARLALRAKTICKPSDLPHTIRRRFEEVCAEHQESICKAISDLDGKATFNRDDYTRETGGGGVARVLTDGAVFEKAGVNLSVVYGQMPQEALKAANERGADRAGIKLEPGQKVPFFACGLSSVMHPKNPFCPTMHFNYRYFETDYGTWWFGGGTDITPSYLDESDMKHFHGTYKKVCDKHNPEWYPRFKKWADDYFYIKHRGETRGLGGIFFDDFNTESQEEHLAFSTGCLSAVTDAYVPLLEKHRNDKFTEEQKAWQQMRRGRYVEFNLVYDRGTIFGLKMLPSGAGRIESILMSLPQTARWQYCHDPEPGSPEADIMDAFKNSREWV